MPESQLSTLTSTDVTAAGPEVVVFVCANCAREGLAPAARLGRPTPPIVPWTTAVEEVIVPCAGRLQPEHLLKAVEAGANLVCIVACAEDNCHYMEGSCRVARRSDYVKSLLGEIGMGEERLMLFHLPGSAREDMAAGLSGSGGSKLGTCCTNEELSRQVGDLAAQVAARLRSLPPSPMHQSHEVEEVQVLEAQEAEDNDE